MIRDNLIDILEEQVFLNFTGRVNVLERDRSMYLGSIVFEEGEIINAFYNRFESIEAFESLFYLEFDKRGIKFVVEPEMTNGQTRKIHFPFSVLRKKVTELMQQNHSRLKKAPPKNIKLAIVADVLDNGKTITSDEFDILKIVCDYNIVQDIYNKSDLTEFRTTNALISLKEKMAIKVVK